MEKHNIHITFEPGAKTAEIKEDVWQHDFGQTLQIEGLSLPPTIEVHYANKGRDTAIPQVGVTKDGITTAPIPNEILSEKGAFTAYIFVTDGKSGETCYTITGYINKRPALKEFDTPEDQEILHAAVGAVNAAAERAESAETKATAAANQTAKDAKQTAADREAVKIMVESVSGIGEQVTKVENLTKQAQTSATNAALSEQAAKTAETNAQTAQAGAETAEGNAELAERNVKASEQAVEKAKQLVTQMGQEVLNNKNHVDQTVQAFDQTAQQAVANVNNAGQTQTERVQSAGNTATESVKTEQGKATQAIETAKTEAVKAVQTEGTTQTGNVTAEGEKQVQAVQQAAQEIVADRERITQNKADIAEIKEEMDNLSSAIINSATGETIVVEDSSDNRFKGLSLYGKSTQVTTTGAQLYSTMPTEGKLINGITFGVKDGGLSLKGTAEGAQRNDGYFFKKGIELSPGTYTISFSGKGNLSEIEVGISDADKNMLLSSFALYNAPQKLTLSEAKTCYVVAQSRVGKSVDCTIYIMLNAGSSALPYEPYTGGNPSPSVEYPQEITSSGDKGNIGVDVYGENLLNITDLESTNIRVDSKGDLLAVTSKTNSELIYENVVYKFSLNPGTYIFMCEEIEGTIVNRNNYVAEIKINKTNIGAGINNRNKRVVFTVDEKVNAEMYLYKYFTEAGKTYTIKGLRLTAVKELPFEAYKPVQSLAIPTPNGIRGLPVTYSNGNYTDTTGQQWICDEIDLERGKYIQRVEKTDLKDLKWSDSWNKNPSYYIEGTFLVYSPNLNCEPTGKAKPLSNKFRYVNNILRDPTTGMDTRQGGGRNIAFRVPVSIAENVEQWSEFVNNNDIEVIYTLETPIEHDLPPEVIEAYKQLRTNYPVTTILNDAEAGMKVEYAADTKNYTDNKIAESVKNQMQNLTNLLSLMPMETQAVMIENDVNRILESEVTK